jgi:hypothetical protein
MASHAPSPYESLICVQEQRNDSMDPGTLLSGLFDQACVA